MNTAVKPLTNVIAGTGTGDVDRQLTAAYVERCREARLRRRTDRFGPEALRLQRGDLYAWKEGPAPASQAVHLSVIAEPRSVAINDHCLWWVPRLDQLLARIELVASRRWPELEQPLRREWIARQLAARVREGDSSWEEAALDLLFDE